MSGRKPWVRHLDYPIEMVVEESPEPVVGYCPECGEKRELVAYDRPDGFDGWRCIECAKRLNPPQKGESTDE